MWIKYVGPSARLETADGRGFPHGEPVEVSDALGTVLLTEREDEFKPSGPPPAPEPEASAAEEKE